MKTMTAAALTLGGIVGFGTLSVINYRRYFLPSVPLNDEKHTVAVTACHIPTVNGTVYGELLTPADSEGRLPVVICCHGYGSHYSLTRSMVGEPLAMSGWAAFCFDFCGGAPRNKSTGLKFHDMTIFTEQADLLAVIDYVKTLPRIDPERIYLLGESQGGMVSAITAPLRSDIIKALVLYYPAFCIPDDARRKYPSKAAIPDETTAFHRKVGGEYFRSTYDFDVFATIGSYHGPVLLLHGDKDAVVPHRYGEMGAAAYDHCEFHTMDGEIHGWTGKGKRKAAALSFAFLNTVDSASH